MCNTTFYLCTITAPSPEAREEASRHLRYWPYVKFYRYQGKRSLLVCFNLGEVESRKQLKQLFSRSRELVLLCLRQYRVSISRWYPLFSAFRPVYSDELFARPVSEMRPFIDFIRELDGPQKEMPHQVRHEGKKPSSRPSSRA